MSKTLLEQLREITVVVADTGDIEAMEKFQPQDATTNPSLITAAAQMPQYQPIVDGVLLDAHKRTGRQRQRQRRREPGLQTPGHRLRQEDSGRSFPAASRRKSTRASPTTPKATIEQARRHHRLSMTRPASAATAS